MNVEMVRGGETKMPDYVLASVCDAVLYAVVDNAGMCIGLRTEGRPNKHSLITKNDIDRDAGSIDGKNNKGFVSVAPFEWEPTPPIDADPETWKPNNRPWKSLYFGSTNPAYDNLEKQYLETNGKARPKPEGPSITDIKTNAKG